MLSDQALDRLLSMLKAAGVNVDAPTASDVQATWEVMPRFAAEPVEDCEPPEQDGDGILAQYGTYGGDTFQIDMTRQFSFVDADGDYDHMAQLNCTFDFQATQALAAAGTDSEWSFGVPLPEFFERVHALPGFAAVRADGAPPLRLDVSYSDV
jgi:hypothetical protein